MNPGSLPSQLADQPAIFSLPIQWGDQDMFGHVNNVVYFRWYESARIKYFDTAGEGKLTQLLQAHKIGPILASITCHYKLQLRYPDMIHVNATVTSYRRTSIKMTHSLYSEALQAIAAEGESTIVMFDYARQKPAPIPDDVKALLEQIEGRKLAEVPPAASQ